MTKLLLIRHATTDMVGKKIAGRLTGVHLNEQGKREARDLAGRLSHVQLSAIYSSPLERASETAAPVAEKLQILVQTLDELIELHFGEWTGVDIADLEQDIRFQLFNTFRSTTQIPGGEWMSGAQLRMVKCLQQLCHQHPGQTIAVVSHGDLIKAAVAYYAGIHIDLFQRIEISPASVSILQIFPETARILLLNDTGRIS